MIGGIAKISSAGFSDVLTIQIKGKIMKAETAMSSPYMNISVRKRESRRAGMAFS
jgi:hypothetical protein